MSRVYSNTGSGMTLWHTKTDTIYSNTGTGTTLWHTKTDTIYSNAGDGRTLAEPKIFKHTFNPGETDATSTHVEVNGVAGDYRSVIELNNTYYDQDMNKLPIDEITTSSIEEHGFVLSDLSNFDSELTLYTLVDEQDIQTVELKYDAVLVKEITYQLSTDKETWVGYNGTEWVEDYWMSKEELETLQLDLLEDEVYFKTNLHSNTDDYATIEELNIEFEPVTDMPSTLNIAESNDLPAELMIPYVITQSVGAAKDTFVNKDRPTLDYSHMERLLVGDDTYRTLIKFDLTEIPEDAIIREAYLDLSPRKIDDTEIKISKLLEDWQMGSTTWANQPDTEEVESLEDLINQWLEGEENNGMLLEVDGFHDYYSSRIEREADKPKLVVKYGMPDGSALNSMSYMESTIEIRERNDLNASVLVQGVNRPNQPATIEVVYGDTEDITGTIGVQTNDIADLESNATISRPNLPSQIVVPERSDLDSTIVARRSDSEDVTGNITASRRDMASTIIVPERNDLDATISTRRDGFHFIRSSVSASRPELKSTITVPYRNDLDGQISARATDESDLDSNITASKPEMPGFIKLIIHNDLNGQISVRVDEESELPSEITAIRKNMIASIIVPENDNIDGTITVRQSDDKDMSSNIGVTRKEITGHLGVVIASSFPSTITVSREDDTEIEGTLGIRGFGSSDLPGQLTPRPRDVSQIPIYIDVHYKHDIMGTIVIAHSLEITATITINASQLKLPRQWRAISNRVINNEQ